MRSVRLETHEGVFPGPVTREDILRAVASLTTRGEAYVILSHPSNAEEYVQGAGTIDEDFLIERRDGCAGEHYRGERRVSAEELVGILDGYLRGAPDWSHTLSWYRVGVDSEGFTA